MTRAPSPTSLPGSLLLAGAGKMGGALLEGWLADGLDPASITVCDTSPSADLLGLARHHGFALGPVPPRAAPDVIVLAVKPQMLDRVAGDLGSSLGRNSLLVSILAGKTIADLKRALPAANAIVRAMPNLPASIGKGITGAFANHETTKGQQAVAHTLLAGVGMVEWLQDEADIDAVTAVSGSGPAYVFLLVECLREAAVAAGLQADVADRLSRATLIGAAALVEASPLPPSTLRENVTSPGGTTAAALEVLMGTGGLAPLLRDAVAAAKRRAGELSG